MRIVHPLPTLVPRACVRLLVLLALTSFAPLTPSSVLPAQSRDSIETHRRLTGDVKRFQSRWRRLWQESIIARNGGWLNMTQVRTDELYGVNTPDVLRLYALTCYVEYAEFQVVYAPRRTGRQWFDSPASSIDGGSAGFNLRVPLRVNAKGNDIAMCPRWIPAELGIMPDEGERLDLALTVPNRAKARALRDTLLRQLGEAAARYPGDRWIAGQRVRFLVDNLNFAEALRVAASCGADAWCAALEGLAHAYAGDVIRAERAFVRSASRTSAPAGAACADTSARPLLPQSVRLRLLDQPCDEWAVTAGRMWWLSQPLWQRPGNVRFVEHYARRTMLALRTVTEEDERYNWRKTAAGDALQEVVMRFGWPTHTWWGGWEVDNFLADYASRLRNQAESPYTVKEYAPDRVTLIPDFRAIESPYDAHDEHWQWERPDGVVPDRWTPAEHMQLPIQLARLPEGQSIVLRRDSALLYGHVVDDPVKNLDPTVAAPLRAYLMASSSPAQRQTLADTLLPFGVSLRLTAELPAEPTVLSIEVPNRTSNEPAHRRRFGVRPPPSLSQMAPGDVAVSDPAFVLQPAYGASPVPDPDSAIARLAGSVQLPRDVPLALYWESYGFAVGDTVDVQLRILRDDGSAVRSIGAFFGVVSAQRDSVSIRWREPDPGRNARTIAAMRPTVARAVTVDIRSLAPGNYVFSVEMQRPGGAAARGERRVEIVR